MYLYHKKFSVFDNHVLMKILYLQMALVLTLEYHMSKDCSIGTIQIISGRTRNILY